MKPRNITGPPAAKRFGPLDVEQSTGSLVMTIDELESLRLVDYEGLMQEEAAFRMGVSRGTVWRCLTSARTKLAIMLVEAKGITISDELVVDGPPGDKVSGHE